MPGTARDMLCRYIRKRASWAVLLFFPAPGKTGFLGYDVGAGLIMQKSWTEIERTLRATGLSEGFPRMSLVGG